MNGFETIGRVADRAAPFDWRLGAHKFIMTLRHSRAADKLGSVASVACPARASEVQEGPALQRSCGARPGGHARTPELRAARETLATAAELFFCFRRVLSLRLIPPATFLRRCRSGKGCHRVRG